MADAFLFGTGGKKLVGDAQPEHVLSGKTFSNAGSNKLTGTMPNRGRVDHQLAINGSFTIPQGYHDGTGTVFQSVTVKGSQTYTPGTAPQTIAANQYLTGVQTIEGDADLIPANIKAGVTIFGVTGSAPIPGGTAGAAQILAGYTMIDSAGATIIGTIPSKSSQTYTPGTSNQTIAAGQYLSGVQTIIGDADLVTGNIKAGANIFGVAGKASVVETSDATATAAQMRSGYTAYVNGSKITGTIPSIGSTTYIPGGTDQIIEAGRYLSGTQTIKGAPFLTQSAIRAGISIFGVVGTFTSDATATAADIRIGKTAYVQGSKITGTAFPSTVFTKRTSNFGSSAIYAILSHNGLAIAGGSDGKIATSPDGITWTAQTALSAFQLCSMCSFNGLAIAIDAVAKLFTSPDGITWTKRTIPLSGFINAVGVHNLTAILVGNDGQLATSANGTTWTVRTSSFGTSDIRAVGSHNGLAIAGGGDGKIATSPDGITWTQRTSPFGTSPVYGICSHNGLAIAVGGNGKIATSPNGITWTLRTTNFGDNFNAVWSHNGLIMALSNGGKVLTSPDGITWTTRTITASIFINGGCSHNGLAIVGGASGYLLTCYGGWQWFD